MPMSDDLTMAEYACAGAHIQYFRKAPLADVLEALGLEPASYNEACTKWTAVLVDESAADETEQAKLYGDSYTRTTAKLRKEKPLLGDIEPLLKRKITPAEPKEAPPSASEPPPVSTPVIVDNGAPPVAVAVPSYLKAPLVAAAAPPPPAAVSSPSHRSAPVGPPATVPAQVLTAPPQIVTPPLVVIAPPLAASPALAPHADVEAADETLPPGSRPDRAAALPFGDTPSPSFLAAVAAPHPVAPRDDAGETMFLAVVPGGSAALPFAKDPDPPLPRLTLEQYASLLVDLGRAPAQRTAVMAQYGIMDEAMMHRLQLLWKTRGELDPMFSAKLEAAKAGYARWLAGRR